MASPISLASLPEPATECDYSVLTNFIPVGLISPYAIGDSGIYLLRIDELRAPSSPISGVGLGALVPRTEITVLSRLMPRTDRTALSGLVPFAEIIVLGGLVLHTEHAALGGFLLTSTAFHDFRTHEPCIRVSGNSAPPGRFVARVSASVATTEGCTGRRSISPAADAVFASVSAIPIESGRSPGCSDAHRTAASSTKEVYTGDGLRRNRRFDCVCLCLAWDSSPSVIDDAPPFSDSNGICTPAVDYGFGLGGSLGHFSDEVQPRRESHGRGRLQPPPRPLLLSGRRSARCHVRPTATPRRLLELLSYGSRLLLVTRRLHIQDRTPSTTMRNCGSRIPSSVIRMPIGSENSTLSLHLYRPAVGPASRRLGVLPLAQASLRLRRPGAGG